MVFTNNSDAPVIPGEIFNLTAEQNGILLDDTVDFYSEDRGLLNFGVHNYDRVEPGEEKENDEMKEAEYSMTWNL